jgi:hypothetical protein
VTPRPHIPDSVRDAVLCEAGYQCASPPCHTTLAIDLHHIIEISKNGESSLDNLVALCPTCHALYHRKVIPLKSIIAWKQRLIRINQGIDIKSEIQSQVKDTVDRIRSSAGMGPAGAGFSQATAEFVWRTCEVCFTYGEPIRYVNTGCCVFVGPNIAITVREVVEMAINIAKVRGGVPAINTKLGFAPFTIRERYDSGKLVAIEMGPIDDVYMKQLLKKQTPDVAHMFQKPLQTKVRFAMAPQLGEQVGILHSPKNTKELRPAGEFQFDSVNVAFMSKPKSEAEFLQFALTPILSHIQYLGSPAFTSDGRLVGIVSDSIQVDGEFARRPVISSVFPLKALIPTAL